MAPDEYHYVTDLVKRESGLVLNSDKMYLLENRLGPLAQRHAMGGLPDLVRRLRASGDRGLIKEVVEAMTTNESSFFRDIRPFELFREKVLPRLLASRAQRKSLRIWCAAASTGQEPYSLAILLQEHAPRLLDWRIDIVATDISSEVLTRAREGTYSQFEIQRGMPTALLVKYFERDGEQWKIAPRVRAMVRFQEYNLLSPLRPLGCFDVVFCRNVLIYFDEETKRRVLGEVRKLMPEDGSLFLGGAETVIGISDAFEPIPEWRGVYRPARGGVANAA